MQKQQVTRYLMATAAALALSACGGSTSDSSESHSTAQTRLRPVLVAPVTQADAGGTLTFSGVVRAKQRASLAFAVPGRISLRAVEVGDQVSKGQRLAGVDSSQFHNARSGAQAGLAEAQARQAQLTRDKARVAQLVQTQAASREELENVTSALESVAAKVSGAKVQVHEARRLVADARIVAPFAGTVTEQFAEVGEYAQPGTPILALMGDGELEVELALPESALAGLIIGSSVSVRLPMLKEEGLTGTVRSISRSTRAGRLFPVTIALTQHEALMPGVTAELQILLEKDAAFSVPVGAIVDPSGSESVIYRVRDGNASRVAVTPLSLQGNRVLLRGELAVGDSIVVAGHSNLIDGQAVEARPLAQSPLHKHLLGASNSAGANR